MRRGDRRLMVLAVPVLLTACTVGPDYVRPTALTDNVTPTVFKEQEGWKPAEPRDGDLRGNWWEMFGDPLLNELAAQVDVSNQNLALAEAQYRQARALVQQARAGYFPIVAVSASATRSNQSAGRNGQLTTGPVNNYSLSADVPWEIDVWGKVRRAVEASQASAQASEADLQSARLSVHAELAQNYFQLRALDAQQQLLNDTVSAYEKSLQLTLNRYAGGVAAKVDVVQAETQLKTAQTQAVDLGVQRGQVEHAIALLVGKPPSTFSLAPAPLAVLPPAVPVGVPSQLLERRPDIAGAERRVAAANAQIGVAKAAYYPSLTLTGSAGYQSSAFAHWLDLPNRFWSIGPSLAATLFDGGLRRAQTDQAMAAYDGAVATYRQTVLGAFQDVEDNLAALRILEQEAEVQEQAVRAARESVLLTTNQYKAGVVSYLNVIQVQTTRLSNEINAVSIQNRRLAASVLLIKALGGGWHATDPPADGLARTESRSLPGGN